MVRADHTTGARGPAAAACDGVCVPARVPDLAVRELATVPKLARSSSEEEGAEWSPINDGAALGSLRLGILVISFSALSFALGSGKSSCRPYGSVRRQIFHLKCCWSSTPSNCIGSKALAFSFAFTT